MPLVEHPEIVETLAPNSSDAPLAGGMLPWRSRRSLHCFDPQLRDPRLHIRTGDAITISEQRTRRCIPGEGLNHRLGRPLDSGRFRDGAMDDAATLVRQDHEHNKTLGGHRRYGEKVTGHAVVNLGVHAGLPRG